MVDTALLGLWSSLVHEHSPRTTEHVGPEFAMAPSLDYKTTAIVKGSLLTWRKLYVAIKYRFAYHEASLDIFRVVCVHICVALRSSIMDFTTEGAAQSAYTT